MRREILIIGAGPTGLGAAAQLAAQGEHGFVILEASNARGGLAGSFCDEKGFTWDLGNHLHYSHYEKVDRVWNAALTPDQWVPHRRSTWVWLAERFVPYPLQLNLHRLPDRWKRDCMEGLLGAEQMRTGRSRDFRDWILATFGRGIARNFMFPYNRKLWAHPLEDMSSQWIAQRVAVPDAQEILCRAERGEDHTQWGPNATFRYPRRGGCGAVWEAVAASLPQGRIRYGERVVRVDARRRIVRTARGSEYPFDYLISSMPLEQLAEALGSGGSVKPNSAVAGPTCFGSTWEAELISRAASLVATATHVVGIGLEGQPPVSVEEKLWIYYPASRVPFHRLTVVSNLSPENTPRPGETWSVMAEVSENPFRALPGRQVVGEVVNGLRSLGIVGADWAILSHWHRRLSHGYPVPTVNRDQILDDALPLLRKLGIYSRGRFGAWKYEIGNQDHAFMQGVEAVEHILHGHRELTLENPDLVNGRYNPFPFPEWEVR